MFDPRQEDITKLSDDKLTDRISDLHKRHNFFYKTGNTGAIQQITVMLGEANMEQEKRWAKSSQMQIEKQEKKNNNILDK